MSHSHSYKGYTFVDDTGMTEEGSYRARAIVVKIVDGRVRSQRFIDLETFSEESAARQRAIDAAQCMARAMRARTAAASHAPSPKGGADGYVEHAEAHASGA